MILTTWIPFLAVSVTLFRPTVAGFCTQTYTCPKTCTRQTSYTTKCGSLNWHRCTKYRTESYSCDGSCTRQVCCSGFTGADCLTPLCYGSTSCANGNTCLSPDNCRCRTGFTLPKCDDINECSSSNGGCQQVCSNTVGTFQCSCHTGYTLESDLKSCHDNDECITNNGGCDHTCTNVAGSYTCSCRAGYVLASDGHTCVDADECQLGTALCDHICTNTAGSYTCSCNHGYSLDPDGHSCADLDECTTTPYPCDQTCDNSPGTYSCGCVTGYQLDITSNTCQDTDECLTSNGNCSQTCSNSVGSFQCSCQTGYVLDPDGATCADIDECSSGVSRCSQVCTNTPGSYSCGCSTGYSLDTDQATCYDVDDCVGVICENGGQCVDNVGSFTCTCSKGFNGKYCQSDVDECAGFLNGGCEDVCVNSLGSFHCDCAGNTTLKSDGYTCSGGNKPSIFSRYGMLRQYLPRGCSTILLSRCSTGNSIQMVMSSTAPWYQLRTDPRRIYTFGVVFVEVNAVALPISIAGIQLMETATDFHLVTGALALNPRDGNPYGTDRTHQCLTFDTTPRDIHDFLNSNSFLASFFHNIEDLLPDWLQFSQDGDVILDINDLTTDLQHGDVIQQGECQGAPLFDDHMYTVLKFGNSFSMTIYGQEVKLPAPANNRKFCIIIDICQDVGGTFFLILPEDSRDLLDKFDMFKSMADKSGLYVRPIGVGVSIAKHLNVHADTTSVQLWNGDELFHYPVFPEGNFWMSGGAQMNTSFMSLSAEGTMFLSVPSPSDLLKNIFLDEWALLMKFRANAPLEFHFNVSSKVQTIRGNINSEITALASLGGTQQRSWCGQNSNPPGIFLSLMFDANAFYDAPILSFIEADVNAKVYAFVTNDVTGKSNDINLVAAVKHVLNFKDFVIRFVNFTHQTVDNYRSILSNYSTTSLNTVTQTGHALVAQIEQLIHDLGHGNHVDLRNLVSKLSDIWHDGWKQLKNNTDTFIDSLRDNTRIVKYNITSIVKQEVAAVQSRVHDVMHTIMTDTIATLKDINGAGFRFRGSINVVGLELIGLDLEMVYAVDSIGSCGRFHRVYDLLKNERAVRVYGGLRTGLIRLCSSLHMSNAGAGIGLALSLEHNDKFALQLHAEARILGIRESVDIFITRNGIHYYIENDVWSIFKAQIDVSAQLGGSWNQLTFDVAGRFVADADGDDSFDDGYLAALRRFTQHLADEADKRISQLQDGVEGAKQGLSSAQDWLDDKKKDIQAANAGFDAAVRSLDRVKDKLEEAKEPFRHAIDKLNEAQDKVDHLCHIRECRKICIPGIKCRICHKKKWHIRIPYPCCRFTSCMISFKDPICLAANVLCRAVRGVAYLALQAAKVFVRVPMLALDAAKVAVDAAQFVVDKSRVVLDIAAAALDLANLGLEHAKHLLDTANLALEAVKKVVKWGVKALNAIIQYGLENIIDVRNCGFELQISTHDKSVFDVHCEVNAFKRGYRTFRLRINFNDIVQSLWYAAKATIEAVLHSVGDLFGRRRREIHDHSKYTMYKFLRETRDVGDTISDADASQTIDVIARTLGFRNSTETTEYDVRTSIFQTNCRTFTMVHTFFQDAIQLLNEMSNETADALSNITTTHNNMNTANLDHTFATMSLADIGVDLFVAQTEFNISVDDINSTVETARSNLSNDQYINDVKAYAKQASVILEQQTNDVSKVKILTHWLVAMGNVTSDYFSENDCVSFLDCAHHAITLLYEMYIPSNDTDGFGDNLDRISDFEDLFLNLTGNNSHVIQDVNVMATGLEDRLDVIERMNVFCSLPPRMLQPIRNQTVLVGDTMTLICDVTGDPAPIIQWYKDDNPVYNETGRLLVVPDLMENDTALYHCVAGNVVANLTAPYAHVTVKPPALPANGQNLTSPSWTTGRLETCARSRDLSGGHLVQHKDYCYEVMADTKVVWRQAETICSSQGGHLVHIGNQEIQSYLYNWLVYSAVLEPMWIGLSALRIGDPFHWTTGDDVTYTNWFIHATANQETCGLLVPDQQHNGTWLGVDCGAHNSAGSGMAPTGQEYGFICEYVTITP